MANQWNHPELINLSAVTVLILQLNNFTYPQGVGVISL